MKKMISFLLAVLLLTPAFSASAAKKKSARPSAVKTEPAAEPVNVLTSLSRLLSFDPHPTTFPVPQPIEIAGKNFTGEISCDEKWVTQKTNAFLGELGATLRLFQGGVEAETITIPSVKLASKKLKAGVLVGEAKGNSAGLQMTVDSLKGSAKAITELTVVFKVIGLSPALTTHSTPVVSVPAPAFVPASVSVPASASVPAKVEPANPGSAKPLGAAPSSGLRMAMALIEKAAAIQAGQKSAKLKLLERALSLIPMGDISPEAATIRSDIQAKISSLSTSSALTGQADSSLLSPTETSTETPTETSAGAQSSHADTAKTIDPQAQAWYKEAVDLLFKEKEPEARDLLRKAVEKAPEYYDAWALLGRNAFENSKYARAKEAFEKVLALKDDGYQSAKLYFKACYYLGDPDSGIEKLKAMVSRYPKAAAPRMALAEAFFQAGDFPECQEQCLQQIALNPADFQAKELLARTNEKLK